MLARLIKTNNKKMSDLFEGRLGELFLGGMVVISFERVGYMSLSDSANSHLTSSHIKTINYDYKDDCVGVTIKTKNSKYEFEIPFDQTIPENEGLSENQNKDEKMENEPPVDTDRECTNELEETSDGTSRESVDSNLVQHTKRELQFLLDNIDENEEGGGPNKWAYDNIIELVEVFSKQGHSGMSAPYVLDIFNEVARYRIIGPLTGEDNEWGDISSISDEEDATFFQNKRDSRVFKDHDECYFLDGTIFEDPLHPGNYMTNSKSRHIIKSFPYTPKTIYKKAPLWQKVLARLFPKYF